MTMQQTLAIHPAALLGFQQQVLNYQNWLVKFVSPVLLLTKFAEAEASEAALRAKYGALLDSRREYLTMRYAVEVLLTGNKFFYQTDPGTKYKPEPSVGEDAYLVELLNLNNYPLVVGFQGFSKETQEYLRLNYKPLELQDAFHRGVAEDLHAYPNYPNINTAQLAVGMFVLYQENL